jgi:hypothetical protein
MKRTVFAAATALALAAALAGCTERRETDRVDQGAHGPTSPAEAGFTEYQSMPKEYQTAGLSPEYTNDKVDPTMEGSGNIAWQGSYAKDHRQP